MAAKALVLDLDGTLYEHSKEVLADAIGADRTNRYLERIGIMHRLPRKSIKYLDRLIAQGRILSVSRFLGSEYGVDRKRLEDYALDVDPRAVGIRRDPRLVRLVAALARDYSVILFTNAKRAWLTRTLSALGLQKSILEGNIMSPELMSGHFKPEPEAFMALLARYSLRGKDIIFLDDKMSNVRQARSMGIRSMLVDNDSNYEGRSIYATLERIVYNNNKLQDNTKL